MIFFFLKNFENFKKFLVYKEQNDFLPFLNYHFSINHHMVKPKHRTIGGIGSFDAWDSSSISVTYSFAETESQDTKRSK